MELSTKIEQHQKLATTNLRYLSLILTIHSLQTCIMAASASKRAKEDNRRKKEKMQEEKKVAKFLKNGLSIYV